MDASSTTLNIAGPQVESPKAEHSHKPNFGRYVADCPACIAKHPDGPPQKPAKAKKSESTGLTREEVIALLKENAPVATDAATAGNHLEALVQLLLTKEGKIARKEQDEEIRRQRAREDMITATKEQEALIKARQDMCGAEYGQPGRHIKENGRSAINGQVHNDGFYHPICFRCFKAFPKVRPGHEQLSTAVQN